MKEDAEETRRIAEEQREETVRKRREEREELEERIVDSRNHHICQSGRWSANPSHL
ncbi:MAG: hypothetical protein K2P48_08005 [Lachnospiraceae bacterium]|nr:hypothetical protein [Lachnospiraceae bacterium]